MTQGPASSSPGAQSTSPGRALVVDDDLPVRTLVQRVLLPSFQVVDVAHNGNQGIAALSAQRYDLIVTDLTMPGTSGLAVVKEAKARYPEAAVLVITGFADSGDEEQIQRLGAELLRKPFGVRELLEAVLRSQLVVVAG